MRRLELFVTEKAIMGAVCGLVSPRLQIPDLLAVYRKGTLELHELLEAGRNLRGAGGVRRLQTRRDAGRRIPHSRLTHWTRCFTRTIIRSDRSAAYG
ncbi:MAG TPA: hypothetical protein VIJ35_14930 [Bradyrhizobium sp.]